MVTGLYSNLIKLGTISDWYGGIAHFDFGYAAAIMMYEESGQDEVSPNVGYN